MLDLTKLEETILISILHLKENAYGINIRRKITDMTGNNLNYGTLYRILDQLAKKDLLKREEGEPLPEKGGRRKIFYKLTATGIKSLQEAHKIQQAVWADSTLAALNTQANYEK